MFKNYQADSVSAGSQIILKICDQLFNEIFTGKQTFLKTTRLLNIATTIAKSTPRLKLNLKEFKQCVNRFLSRNFESTNEYRIRSTNSQ